MEFHGSSSEHRTPVISTQNIKCPRDGQPNHPCRRIHSLRGVVSLRHPGYHAHSPPPVSHRRQSVLDLAAPYQYQHPLVSSLDQFCSIGFGRGVLSQIRHSIYAVQSTRIALERCNLLILEIRASSRAPLDRPYQEVTYPRLPQCSPQARWP